MPTMKEAKQAFEAMSKDPNIYMQMNEEGKRAAWNYGKDQGYFDRTRLTPAAQVEYDKYESPWATYAPESTQSTIQDDLKVDKYAGYKGPKAPLQNNKPSVTPTKQPMPKLSPNVKRLIDDEPVQPIPQPSRPAMFGEDNRPTDPITKFLGNTAMNTLKTINSVIQAPATIGVRGKQSLEKGEGVLKGYGQGIKDALTGQNTVENAEYIENLAPKTTAELKAKYPKPYQVLSTLANFVGVDDLFAIGIAGDIAKLQKLNNMPTSTADLNKLFNKIKTNAPLTTAEQAIVKENPEIKRIIGEFGIDADGNVFKNGQLVRKLNKGGGGDIVSSEGKKFVDQYGNIKGIAETDLQLKAPVTPKKLQIPSKGKTYAIKNTALEKAKTEYDDAIETIQNYFGTNELRTIEVPRIKSELGIDIEQLVKNLEDAKPKDVRALSDIRHAQELFGLKSPISLNAKNLPKLTPSRNIERPFALSPLEQNRINPPKAPQPPLQTLKPLADTNTQQIPKSGLKPNVGELKERGFAQNVKSDITTPQNIVKGLDENKILYEPISNQGTLNKVLPKVEANPTEALTQVLSGTGRGLNAEDVATGELLIKKAFESGDDTQAYSIISSLAEKLTEAGQAIQAASMFKKMTPEGMLMYAERTVAKANRDMEKVIDPFKKYYKKGQLTDEIRNAIKLDMEDAMKLPEGREKSVKMAQIMQTIGEAMPTTPGSKLESARTIAMLSNPKTWVRNIVGNAAFGGVEAGVTKPLSTLIDKGLKAKTGQRTVSNTNLKKLTEGLKEGTKNALDDFKLGIDTSPTRGMLELPRANTFKNIPVLDQLERTVKLGVSGGDRPFYSASYKDALEEQLKLHRINTGEVLETATDAMKQAADEVAKYRTYADNNMISDSLSQVKRGLNRFRVAGIGAGDVLMKFTKTPANLLARGIDYSPAGLIKGIVDVGRVLAGNTDLQRTAAEGLSRGIIGTGFVTGAIALTNLGIMRGKRAKSTTADKFEQATGRGQYTINTSALNRFVSSGFNTEKAKPQANDTIQTYDWAQPLALSAGTGANISEDLKRKQKVDALSLIGTVIESLESGVNTIVEQPMLQNISRVFKGENPVQGLMSVVQSYPASFVPAFLQGMRYAADDTLRDTSGNFLEGASKLVINKIPGASKKLTESIDVLGKPRKVTAETPIGRLLDGALNPARTTKIKNDKTTETIMSLYNSTNDGKILPNLVERTQTVPSTKKGESPKELTVEQRNQYQKLLAEAYMSKAQNIINNTSWESYTLEKKIDLLTSARTKSDNEARKQMQQIIFGR